MGIAAVSDAGPIIHLHEVGASKAFAIAKSCTTPAVAEEVRKYEVPCALKIVKVDHDKTSFFVLRHEIGVGEASCLALCKQEDIKLFFTDDLSARAAAYFEGIEPHGTIGILLRAYRDGILSKEATLKTLQSIPEESTLFITRRLVDEAIKAVEKFER